MIVKEQQVKDMLFIEAATNREHHKRVVINDILFKEADERFAADPQSFIDPKPMARQSGGSNLKNAGTNTSWTPVDPSAEIDRVQSDVKNKADSYFQGLMSGASVPGDLTPRPIKIKFRYIRSIEPKNDPESLQKATNALDVLDKHLPGFKAFKDALTKSKVPLSQFFMPSNHASNSGYVAVQNPDILNNFIQSEAGKPLMTPDGQQLANDSHYKPHLERIQGGGKIKISGIRQNDRILSTENDLDGLDSKQLIEAISTRAQSGFTLDEARLKSTLLQMRDAKLKRLQLNPKTATEQEKNDIRTIGIVFEQEVLERMKTWFKEGRADDLPIFLLRQIMRHMKHPTKGFVDKFKFKASTLHSSNGWDDDSPGVSMLAIPPIRQLPMPKMGEQHPEIRYDRGNGNMGYDHLTDNWKNGLGQIVQNFGGAAVQWLQQLQSGEIIDQLRQESLEAYEAAKNVFSNRTGAENLLDTLGRYGANWKNFSRNHVQKSMFNELDTVHKLRKTSADQTQFKPGIPLPQQIQDFSRRIGEVAKQDPARANEILKYLSADLVNNYYMQGKITWDTTTLALSSLNKAAAVSQLPGNGMSLTAKPNSIDEAGFEMLKQSGYQVAKMMDFLNAVMGRSSYKQLTTRPDGQPENFFNYKYTTSSGTSDGGFITLEVSYDELSAQVSNQEVHVNEQLSFLLGQATGADRDEPIINRRSQSWKQMLDWVITIYPEVGFELIEMNEHIYDNLQLLETKVKQAINESRNQIQVVYNNSDGTSQILEGSDLDLSEMSTQQDAEQTSKEPIPGTNVSDSAPDNLQLEPTPESVEQSPVPGMSPQPHTPTAPVGPTTPKEDEPMVKSMPSNSLQYLQKRKNPKRKLFRERPAALGSIEERLLKAANKLDTNGEVKVADKIDLLLQKLHEAEHV